jgi:hypothetical protein
MPRGTARLASLRGRYSITTPWPGQLSRRAVKPPPHQAPQRHKEPGQASRPQSLAGARWRHRERLVGMLSWGSTAINLWRC